MTEKGPGICRAYFEFPKACNFSSTTGFPWFGAKAQQNIRHPGSSESARLYLTMQLTCPCRKSSCSWSIALQLLTKLGDAPYRWLSANALRDSAMKLVSLLDMFRMSTW